MSMGSSSSPGKGSRCASTRSSGSSPAIATRQSTVTTGMLAVEKTGSNAYGPWRPAVGWPERPSAGGLTQQERRGQQILQVRSRYRNLLSVLDGHHVFDCRARTGDCRRRSAAKRIQGFPFCRAGGPESFRVRPAILNPSGRP
jgi:hypothetical protein